MRPSGGALRRLALAAVSVSLAALAAAVCALSYPSVHDLAAAAGVPAALARVYPAACDALLVMAGCSVLALHGAGLFSKVYAWLCLLVLLAALATASAAWADGIRVTGRPAAIADALIPWGMLLAGLGLLLVLLRHARLSRAGLAGQAGAEPPRPGPAELPAVGSPAVEPPAVEPPAVEPPAVGSPAVELPAVGPPAVELPAVGPSLAFAVPPARPAALALPGHAELTAVAAPHVGEPTGPPELRRAHSSPTPPGD
jgi:uncharacterized membrane protein SirB2